MGKRLLSSPEKRSHKKKAAVGRGSSKHLSNEKKSAGTVSVADLFSKQKEVITSVESFEDEVKSEVEVIDISDSPVKAGPSVKNSPTVSPYFSPVKCDEASLSRIKSIPPRTVWTKLSLKRSLKSEPSGLKSDSQLSLKKTKISETEGRQEVQDKTDTQIPENQARLDENRPHKSRLSLGKRNKTLETSSSAEMMHFGDDKVTEIVAKKKKLEVPGERNYTPSMSQNFFVPFSRVFPPLVLY